MQIFLRFLVDLLKSVGALEIEFVAHIPEQIATITMHFSTLFQRNG